MHTAVFIVTMLIFAAANTVQQGTDCKDSQTLNQMDPMQLNEISNRARRSTSELIDISEILKDENSRSLLQDILSHIPSKDIIEGLLSRRIKRSYFDYDSPEDQENINPKNQLEQISSGNFAPNALNEEQRRKLFFSQLFSMIDGSTNFEKSKSGYKNDQLTPKNLGDIAELVPEKSQNQRTDKHSDVDLKKDVYVPIRKIKKRRQVQESSSFPQDKKKINARHERQLDELITNGNADTQFYKFNNYASSTADDYDSVEPSMEQHLPYGPTGDDEIETPSVNILSTTTDSSTDHDTNEEVNYHTQLVSSSPSSFDIQSSIFTTPDNVNITEENNLISTYYPLNLIKHVKGQINKVSYFKTNATEASPTIKNINTSDVVESIENFVENENEPITKDSSSNNNSKIMTNFPVENVINQNQSLYTNAPAGIRNDFNKMQSRRTNANLEDEKIKPQQIENVSKFDQKKAGETQDVEVTKVYGEADIKSDQNNVLVNPLSARIKLDFLIQLQALGNDV